MGESGSSFDRSRLKLAPLSRRVNDLDLSTVRPLAKVPVAHPSVPEVARRIAVSRAAGRPVILMMGGHVVRAGVQRYLIDLLERGLLTGLAMNGSCVIHDFEMALMGGTTESVARYIRDGGFGMWNETGTINDIVNAAWGRGETLFGAAVGRAVAEGEFPHQAISLLAACHRLGVPATVHVGIGQDIIHQLPNFDGAATGALSYGDFLLFASQVERLEGGVVMNFGSAVMAPEVYLKALSMARNVAHQRGESIARFTTAVCDLHELPADFRLEPQRSEAAYYFRPWKTMLVRTVADGGESFYLQGRHGDIIPQLWTALGTTDEGR